jgi:hypothetical protein
MSYYVKDLITNNRFVAALSVFDLLRFIPLDLCTSKKHDIVISDHVNRIFAVGSNHFVTIYDNTAEIQCHCKLCIYTS